MSDWIFLNKHRCRVVAPTVPQQYISDDSYGFTGLFRFNLGGRLLRCLASDGMGWQHVSVSEEFSPKPPPWEIMCKVKDLFFEPEDVVVQFHPAKSQYVNMAKGCLHLWRSLSAEFPTPPSLMVGFRNAREMREYYAK